MTLQELLVSRHSWTEGDTIYMVQPWSREAEVILSNESPDLTDPILRSGKRYDYFLEGLIARDLLEDMGVSEDVGVEASERLIRYATDDA